MGPDIGCAIGSTLTLFLGWENEVNEYLVTYLL